MEVSSELTLFKCDVKVGMGKRLWIEGYLQHTIGGRAVPVAFQQKLVMLQHPIVLLFFFGSWTFRKSKVACSHAAAGFGFTMPCVLV